MQTEHNICYKSQLVGGKSVGYLQSVALEQDLNQPLGHAVSQF